MSRKIRLEYKNINIVYNCEYFHFIKYFLDGYHEYYYFLDNYEVNFTEKRLNSDYIYIDGYEVYNIKEYPKDHEVHYQSIVKLYNYDISDVINIYKKYYINSYYTKKYLYNRVVLITNINNIKNIICADNYKFIYYIFKVII